jgi:hypothetical protein
MTALMVLMVLQVPLEKQTLTHSYLWERNNANYIQSTSAISAKRYH